MLAIAALVVNAPRSTAADRAGLGRVDRKAAAHPAAVAGSAERRAWRARTRVAAVRHELAALPRPSSRPVPAAGTVKLGTSGVLGTSAGCLTSTSGSSKVDPATFKPLQKPPEPAAGQVEVQYLTLDFSGGGGTAWHWVIIDTGNWDKQSCPLGELSNFLTGGPLRAFEAFHPGPDTALWVSDGKKHLVLSQGIDVDALSVLVHPRAAAALLSLMNFPPSSITRLQVDAPLVILKTHGDCAGCDLAGTDLSGIALPDADLAGANLDGATLYNDDLDRADLSEASFKPGPDGTPTTLDSTSLKGANLAGAAFDSAALSGVDLEGARLGCATFANTPLLASLGVSSPHTSWTHPDVDCPPQFTNGTLIGLNTVPADQARFANFDGAMFLVNASNQKALVRADLSGAKLSRVSFVGLPPDFAATNFDGADLEGAGFAGARFAATDEQTGKPMPPASFQPLTVDGKARPVNAKDAIFAGAFLRGARFDGAELWGADFDYADIAGASFVSAQAAQDTAMHRSAASFVHAYAEGADFAHVNASYANFTGMHLYHPPPDGAFAGAQLANAKFFGAVLGGNGGLNGSRVSFGKASLDGADLSAAECIGCSFLGASLGEASLRGTFLQGADLTGVTLWTDANLTDAVVSTAKGRWTGRLAPDETPWEQDYDPTKIPPNCQSGDSSCTAQMSSVGHCPSGVSGGAVPIGCATKLVASSPPDPPACVAAGPFRCGSTISAFAGSGTKGASPDNTAADVAKLNAPSSVVAAPGGSTVYVADTGNGRVLAIPTSGGGIKTVATGLKDPVALAVGVPVAHTADTLYVADRAGNRVYAIRGTRKLVVAGTGTAGFSGDGGPAADAELSAPSALFVDPLGNLYIADAGNHRVRMVDPGGIITTVAGTGVAGSSPDGTPATDAKLMSPDGLTGDADGNLYIADAGANRVYRVDPVGKLTTFAGTGEAGYTAAGPATDAKFSAPGALAFVGVSYTLGSDPVAPFALYVLDTGNDVVRVINAYGIVQPELAGVARTAGATGDGGPAAAAMLNAPAGLWASPSGDRVYIADAGNNRVRVLRGPGG